MWHQRQIHLRPLPRGFHLVTRQVVEALPELGEFRVGLAHLHLLHTSASLFLNENASPDVQRDFATSFTVRFPRAPPHCSHTTEGPDDMPAHVQSSLLTSSLTLPIRGGPLALGAWQGSTSASTANELKLTIDGEPVTDGERVRAQLAAGLERNLDILAQLAMLRA